ncbi:MAG: hypothetical protein AABZ47_00180 [Planctomycetota bacterium]
MKVPGVLSLSVVVVSGFLCQQVEASAWNQNGAGVGAGPSNSGLRWQDSPWFDSLVSGRSKPGHFSFGNGWFENGPHHQHGTPHVRLPSAAGNSGDENNEENPPYTFEFEDEPDGEDEDYTPGEVGDEGPPIPPDEDNGEGDDGNPPNFGVSLDQDGGDNNRNPPPDTRPVPAPGALLLALLGIPCVARICRRRDTPQ